MIDLIAFLGNFGEKYENTRHNAAWIICSCLKISSNVMWQNKFHGQYARVQTTFTQGRTVHLLKPETYMNLSGQSVGAAACFFKIPAKNILIVHDELEIKPSVLSLKWAGGLGGHNGLRSIKNALGTADFWRLRLGIGRPPFESCGNGNIADYVLSIFSPLELAKLKNTSSILDGLFEKLVSGTEPDALLKEWAKVQGSP